MAQFDFFEDLESYEGSSVHRPDKPIWKVEGNKELLQWLKGEFHFLLDYNHSRFRQVQKNRCLYQGIQYNSQGRRSTEDDRRNLAFRKVVMNHLYDIVQNRVSKMIQFKPGISVLAANDEFEDKVAAKSLKDFQRHIWNQENFEGLITPEVAENVSVDGECYLFITWEDEKGEIHPEIKRAEEKGEKIPKTKPDGTPVLDENGEKVMIEEPVKVGDVDYDIALTTEVLLDIPTTKRFKDSKFAYRIKTRDVHELREEYPDKAEKIRPQVKQGTQIYLQKCTNTKTQTNVYEFYYKADKHVPKGRKIVFTDDVILEDGTLPYSHGQLPFVRITDIEYPDELHGYSFIENIRSPIAAYNNSTNMILRNQYLVSHPKWLLPAGSAKMEQLGNDVTVVKYKGPQPPQLVQNQPTPPEVFTFREKTLEEIQQISGVFGVSRGEPPAGVKAGVALQFLSEQENQRFNKIILKWNEWIRQVTLMTLKVARDYYERDDERTLQVLGKNNNFLTKLFDPTSLNIQYDVRVQNSSALPESKAQRIQTIIDLSQQYPNLFSQDQILDMLGFAQSEKFIDDATMSVRHADMENEIMQNKEAGKVEEPKEWEDHVIHWSQHVRLLRDWAFTHNAPKKVVEDLKDHIRAHELLMSEKARLNDTYAEQLKVLSGFPILYVPEEIVEQAARIRQQQVAAGVETNLPSQDQPIEEQPPFRRSEQQQQQGGNPQSLSQSQAQQQPANPRLGSAEPQQPVNQ